MLSAPGVRGSVVPAAADRAWRRRPWLRAADDRTGAGQGRGGLRRRGDQPLAGGASARCGARVPAGAREGPARLAPARRGEEGIPSRQIAEAIGAGLGVPARSVTPEEAPAYLDFLAGFFAMDNLASSAITRETLGWRPEGPSCWPTCGTTISAEATASGAAATGFSPGRPRNAGSAAPDSRGRPRSSRPAPATTAAGVPR
ncbi:MAG: hypothetical protein WDM85_13430 [Caulobacteraceae bacterium]